MVSPYEILRMFQQYEQTVCAVFIIRKQTDSLSMVRQLVLSVGVPGNSLRLSRMSEYFQFVTISHKLRIEFVYTHTV